MILPAYVHVFKTVIPRNQLPRMFFMNQARYSTVTFLRGLCKFAISATPTTCQFSIENFQKPAMNVHHFTLQKSLHIHRKFTEKHTPKLEVYAKETHMAKLIMTSTLGKRKYCVQKTIIQRDVGLRIYYFAYMNSQPFSQSTLYTL